MRVIGIDPGTFSFDILGIEDSDIFLESSLPSAEVAGQPEKLVEAITAAGGADIIVGPSGYGLPLTYLKDASDKELSLMLPAEGKGVSVNAGILKLFHLMKEKKLNVIFTPGVIHLKTVPAYRKLNKLDMGTADKVCVAALAIREQAARRHIAFRETSLIVVEMGYGFNAAMAIQDGKVIDGIGGTSGGPGFLSPGALDAELAIRFRRRSQAALFTGGIRDFTGKVRLEPEKLDRYPEALNLMVESVAKIVASLMVSNPAAPEIIVSGRLARIPAIGRAVYASLARFAPVLPLRRRSEAVKEAAEGACIIGNGILGGEYRNLVKSLKLDQACGTMYDYVKIKGF